VPTQFVFYLLNERCPEGVLRILLISTSVSNTFLHFLKKSYFVEKMRGMLNADTYYSINSRIMIILMKKIYTATKGCL
jgi:hypothetical protein